MLNVQRASFSYGKQKILNNLSFSLEQGEIGTLIGTSGSGKSTLFKLMTGICILQSGEIKIANHSFSESSKHVSCMMQEDMLLPWRNVISNITLAAELGNPSNNAVQLRAEAHTLLVDLGLSGCADLFPDQLSGGMRQRVSLARALILKRPLLLLDEPFGALDVILREQMYALLRTMQQKYGTTMLMVTHDFRDALSLSDKIFLLSKGQISHTWSICNATRESYAIMNEMRENLRVN